jgi:DNA-binding transcriptional LysR family regulator
METITRNIEDLLAFHRVAQLSSFTRASESLGASKALISKQVARLESELRVRLIRRSTRSLALTDEGLLLQDYCRKIFELSEEAGRHLRERAQDLSGVLRISMPVSLAESFAASFVDAARISLPRVHFDFDSANEIRRIPEEADFALRATEQHAPELVARYLGRMRDVVCATPAIAGTMPAGGPEVLARCDCIMNSHRKAWNEWTLVSENKETQVKVRGRLATNQYSTVKHLALASQGIGRLPYYLVADEIADGRLVELFPEHHITTHSLYLVYFKDTYASRKHALAKELILKWFAERPHFFTHTLR